MLVEDEVDAEVKTEVKVEVGDETEAEVEVVGEVVGVAVVVVEWTGGGVEVVVAFTAVDFGDGSLLGVVVGGAALATKPS